ncbi:MAG: LTA synthase family protein, partial [Eubacterium sp.]|nr:LTA synthase family protein [Eubacterium sp.]
MTGLRTPKSNKYKIFWIIYWCASLAFLLIRKDDVLSPVSDGDETGKLVLALLIAALAVSALISHLVLYGRRQYDERGHEIRGYFKPYHIILLVLNGVGNVAMMEWVNNPDLKEMQIRYMLLNLAGIMIMTAIFLFWLNSWRRTLIAILSLYGTMTVIFYAVNGLRGEPFQFIDVFSLGTAMGVANNFTFVMSRQLVAAIVLTLCVMGMYLQLPDVSAAHGIIARVLIRAGVFGFMVGMYFFYLNVNWNGELGILTDLFAPAKTYKKYGTTVGFFCVAKYMRLTPPDGYTVEKTREIAEASEKEQVPNDTTDVQPVNIIAIMNESWADYRKVGDLRTNIDVMPYYDAMSENTIKGSTLVCIRGGGTAKSEYEFLTGNSVKRFPGMVPYVSYFLHDQYSLVTTLKSQGYEAIAMHPYKATNWNRPTAYRLLGFDQFLSQDDFDEDTDRVRSFISDRGNYEKIIEMVENK